MGTELPSPHLYDLPLVNVKLIDLLVAAARHEHILLIIAGMQRDAIVDLEGGKGGSLSSAR